MRTKLPEIMIDVMEESQRIAVLNRFKNVYAHRLTYTPKDYENDVKYLSYKLTRGQITPLFKYNCLVRLSAILCGCSTGDRVVIVLSDIRG